MRRMSFSGCRIFSLAVRSAMKNMEDGSQLPLCFPSMRILRLGKFAMWSRFFVTCRNRYFAAVPELHCGISKESLSAEQGEEHYICLHLSCLQSSVTLNLQSHKIPELSFGLTSRLGLFSRYISWRLCILPRTGGIIDRLFLFKPMAFKLLSSVRLSGIPSSVRLQAYQSRNSGGH